MSECRGEHRYQAFYCEENVWWLLQHPEVAAQERYALFITNALRQCPLWAQRAGDEDGFVVWDYHVVAVVVREAPEIWDLDSRLDMPLPLGDYLAATFPPEAPKAPPFAPRFRLVPGAEMVTTFRTDRSHMRGPDGWLHPPPPWPPPNEIDGPSNLMRFLDLNDPMAGTVLDLPALRRRFGL